MHRFRLFGFLAGPLVVLSQLTAPFPSSGAVSVIGEIVDARSGEMLPARIHVRGEDGRWYFPGSASEEGKAVRYERRSGFAPELEEMYTTLSAHPFRLELPEGRYDVLVERGKEYLPLNREFQVAMGGDPVRWRLPLTRWINMAERGWFSGDTHCHRDPREVSNEILAEDLNVTFPLTYWTTVAERAPIEGNKNSAGEFPPEPVSVDATHVWYPRNTEYEIFQVGARRHTLGAILILGHETPFEMPALPLREVARKARAEGALLDLEKHNWEWAFIAVTILPVDLFELGNNHNWRVGFGVKNWGVPAADWMQIAGSKTIENELDWIHYGWQTYYALLNCGLRIRPTAGTANGVHPVPLGHSRVYVQLEGPFSCKAWMAGLKAGRSFVTSGPMLLATVDGQLPGEIFTRESAPGRRRLQGEVGSVRSVSRLEVVWNGGVVRSLPVTAEVGDDGGFVTRFETSLNVTGSGWAIVRCFEAGDGDGDGDGDGVGVGGNGIGFAHTAPWFFEVDGQPLKPRAREVAYFIRCVEEEIGRNTGVLSEDQLVEYREALEFWKAKGREAEGGGF